MSTISVGKQGENLAVEYLQQHYHYTIVERNFRTRFEELDIVALDGDTLVFIEVKTRNDKQYGLPAEAVTPWKIKRLKKAATYYRITHPSLPELLRIDVVVIELAGDVAEKIELIKNVTGM